ncbi:MAG: signal recognition particle-docking protein FtsY, partial [Limnospira sp.]
PAAEPEVIQTSPEVEETPPAAETVDESVPIWARGQAERQARIDRLKETAIEEPEPEPATATSATSEVEFDEMFMWSAGVLANQGRRPDEVAIEEITWLQKLWKGLGRTRRNLLNQLKAIVGAGPLNQEAVEEIEALLLQADVGVEATEVIIEALQDKLREEALPPEDAIAYLKQVLRDLLEKPYQNGYSPTFAPEKDQLNIWLITGVNGAGKTTTIGKIAHIARKSDYRTLIAAGDTFRAAAVEQVKVWGDRSGVEVIANPGKNTDPAAVVFDAIAAARSRDTELLIIDTAGRLQNKKNLMEELNKIRRVIDKKASDAVVESLLVLDATLGQNGLRQAQVFAEVAQLSGVVLTKLDGTAKGGVALAVVQQLGLPIRFIGVGESIEDLRPFSSYEFIEALLSG